MLRKRCADPVRVGFRWTGGAGGPELAADEDITGRRDVDPVRIVTWLGGAEQRIRCRRAVDGFGDTEADSSDAELYAESYD